MTRNHIFLQKAQDIKPQSKRLAFSSPCRKDLPYHKGIEKPTEANVRYSTPLPGRVWGWQCLMLSIGNLIFLVAPFGVVPSTMAATNRLSGVPDRRQEPGDAVLYLPC